ncbi:ImmA/IrrE family metallo-endopeptidase [Stenotrophomonas sp. ATCM1_4]|uniref:ImmA/IrrE family metallo-endopeptidase n=1 Tax=Stenotrophomonas sp. ATCM1_4 TaxID=2259330 RepID=UPI0010492DFA|nr:ImmA/IrrE family metallo-endopeptidase [Stenotrophomonas sp. ATCM1_4]TDB26862.1 ImmA/IrrE family metallo-endopeptidase [Stenotrophomonas sp. ATCM1_4]
MNEERARANRLLIDQWSPRGLPIDPAEIARSLGILVEGTVFDFEDDTSLHGVSGQYIGGFIPTIRYEATDSPNRQKFTIAHELGHHVMGHGDRFRDTAKSFYSNNWDPVEVSANRFAAELLMPHKVMENYVVRQGITDLHQLASIFGVSDAAVKYRLINLGLL